MIRARLHRVFRGVGAALAALTLASPLLGSLHEADVRHIACPEDGELIDAPAAAPHRYEQAPVDSPALFAGLDPAGPRESERNHEHCAVILQAHLRAREQSRTPLVVAVPDAVATTSVPTESPRLRTLAVYRLAPKASPPLV